MTDLYDILKANRLNNESDPWLCILGEAWRASEEGYKEYTGLVPYTFIGNGAPLLDYLISGNMVQTGTPTLTTPIQPQECGERTGNLFDYKTAYAQYLSGDDIVITPTQMTSERQYFKSSEVGKTITISVFAKTVTSNRVFLRASIGVTNINSNTVSRGNSGTLTVTVTPTRTSDFFNLTYGDGGDYNTFNKFMVNEGSTALPYEPYGYKIPISSAGQTTPVYLGEVETTRKIKKLVLTGEENITTEFVQINRAQIEIETGQSGISTPLMSTHYGYEYGFSDNTAYVGNSRPDLLYINDTAHATSVANFKSFLAQQYANGTPVTVWYVLANETTGILNEPLRKIGEYADTLSMEQAGVQIPTNRGNTVIDVETELKPSQVYIKYQE